MDDQEGVLNYLAGFLEADGNVCITNNKGKYKTLIIQVSQTRDEYPIDLFVKVFGGAKYKSDKLSPITKAKLCYKWVVANTKALEVLIILLPYCRFRKQEFESFSEEFVKYQKPNEHKRGRPRKY